MGKPNIRGDVFRNTQVCIDSYENDVLCGSIHNPYYGSEGHSFKSTNQFLLAMEQLLGQTELPQAFQNLRTFAGAEEPAAVPAEERRCSGKLASFTVRVLFRQNASWQGSVTWQEGRQEESFRSVLELLLLMHSALRMEKVS